LRAGTDIRPDERSAYMMIARHISNDLTLVFIYPRLFRLDTITPEVGVAGPDGNIILPPTVQLSSEKLDRGGVFLLEDGQNMWLWVGKAASADFLLQLLGVPTLDNVDTTQVRLLPLNTDVNTRVLNIITEIRAQRPTYMNLYVVREGEPREAKFFSYFVEDRTKSVHSYYEFLVNLHQRIQAKITKK